MNTKHFEDNSRVRWPHRFAYIAINSVTLIACAKIVAELFFS